MQEDEPRPITQIFIDEDVSLEKLTSLIHLSVEEERLDYKDSLDFSDKLKAKKSKIDLTCDIISIANTNGGYVIIGVREKPKGHFELEGVTDECAAQTTQENLVNFIGNYVDSVPKLVVRAHVYEGKRVVIIFIGKSREVVPFKQDGQFGNNELKFSAGEIFVRHGAISTKANYSDIKRFVEDIRSEERRTLNVEGKGTAQIVGRLDKLIEVFTGSRPSSDDFDIFDNSLDAIEDHVFHLSSQKVNDPSLKRLIHRYFQKLRAFLRDFEKIADHGQLSENVRVSVPPMLEKLIPLWNSLIESENTRMSEKVADEIYSLWELTFQLEGLFSQGTGHKLLIQAEIIKTVYVLAAISVKENNPTIVRQLVRRKAEPNRDEHGDSYWFRYVLTWLSRAGQLKVASLVHLTMEAYKDNQYVRLLFDSEEKLLIYLCQTDFIQCANSFIDPEIRAPWPSFRMHRKVFIIPIIEDIIRNNNNKWIEQVSNEKLVELIDHFEKFETREIWGNWNWNSGITASKTIEELRRSVAK